MTSTRLPGDVRRILAGNTLSALGTGFTLPFLLIYLTKVRGFTLPTAGYVIATMGFVGLATVPFTGSLADRIGPWRVLTGSLLCEAAGTAGIAAVSRPWQAFAVLSLVAAGQGAMWPAQMALIASLVPPERRSRAYASQFALINLGIGIGGAVSGMLVNVHHVWTFEVIYLVDALSFLSYAAVLATIRATAAPPPSPEDADAPSGGYRDVFADRLFLRMGLVTLLLATAGYGQIGAGFQAFAADIAHVSTRVIGFAFAANTGVIVAAQLAIERRLTGHRRTRALAGVAVVWMLSWLVIGSAGLAGGRALPAVAIIGGLGLFGLGETLWAPTGATLVNAVAPAHLRGRYNAVGSLTWQLSAVLGPVLAGALLGAGHPGVYIAVLVGVLACVAVLAVRLERHLSPDQNGVLTVQEVAEEEVVPMT